MAGARTTRVIPLLLLLGAAGAGCATIEPGRVVLDSIELQGNEALSRSEIETRLALAETPDWPWADPQYFERGTLAGDRRRLLRFYRSRGFYETKVTSKVSRKGPEVVDVTFVIQEGPQSTVAKLELTGLAELPAADREKLAPSGLPLQKGGPITEEAYDATREAIAARLRSLGYADATVEGHVEVDVVARKAVVSYAISPGPRLKFGRVLVSGAVAVPRPTIIATVRDAIPDGKRYDEEALGDAQRQLFDLGVFAGVRVARGPTDPRTGTVPVIVTLRESPFQTVRAGVGAGVDSKRQEARVSAEYTNRNFFGGLRRLSFENRFGYAFVPSILDTLAGTDKAVNGVVGTSALDFTQPNLIRRLDLNTRLEYERGLEEGFDFDAIKGRVGFPIRLLPALVFTPSYNLEFYDVRGRAESSGRAELSAECNSLKGTSTDVREPCILSYVEERLIWDRRDDPLDPRSGSYTALALQQGAGAIGSKFDYNRATLEERLYFPLPARMVLALKGEGGVLLPRAGQVSPIMERFFGGGGSSTRSYGTSRLSPQSLKAQDCVTYNLNLPAITSTRGPCVESFDQPFNLGRSLDPDLTVPIGGDALLEGSAELRIPVYGDLGLALFSDVGNVTRGFDERDPDGNYLLLRPNVVTGAGLRYHTLFGPVRLDFAYRVISQLPTATAVLERTDPVTGEVTQTSLSERPVAEDSFSFHFAIGEAF